MRDCELERVRQEPVGRLAALAGEVEVRFLVAEHARIQTQWDAIRETDAGDVSDDYWRMATALVAVIAQSGPVADDALRAVVGDLSGPDRKSAAMLLEARRSRATAEWLGAAIAGEEDAAVRAALQRAFETSVRESWWRRWLRWALTRSAR